MNPSGYGERYVEKVVNGTGETLLCTPRQERKTETYNRKGSGGWQRGSRRGS